MPREPSTLGARLARLRHTRRAPWLGPLLALLVVYGLFAAWQPETFATAAILGTIPRQTAVVATAAVGMTLVVILGGIDLSVGSVVALTTVVIALRLEAHSSPGAAVLAGLLAAAAAGLVNGALVGLLRMNPFIVTLGSMSVLRGVAKGLAHEQKIDCQPGWIETLLAPGSGVLVPWGVWLAIFVALLATVALHLTRAGRHVFAVGSSEATSRLAGLHVPRIKLAVYVAASLLAGCAGVLELSTLTVGDPTGAVGLELSVIAAVVIGGGSLSGGEGSIAGTLLGALLMTVIASGCTHAGLPNWVQEIVTGGIIVAAVGLDRLRHR